MRAPLLRSTLSPMPERANPLLPAFYDVVWSSVGLLMLVLLIVCLVSLARNAPLLTSGQALAWTLVAIFVPIAGPLAWLFIGRRAAVARVTGPRSTDTAPAPLSPTDRVA